MSKIQKRGHCPCCGNEQAVLANGRMSQHGYTIQHNYFSGVCPGHQHAPIEHTREVADKVVSDVRLQAAAQERLADEYETGSRFPEMANSETRTLQKGRWVYDRIPFALATEYNKNVAVQNAIAAAVHMANNARGFANYLEGVTNTYYGKPLREVAVAEAPAPVRAGEKRQAEGGMVLTATRIEGGRVYWKATRANGTPVSSWTGTQSWRRMPLVSGD